MLSAINLRKAPIIPLVMALFIGIAILFPGDTVWAQNDKHVGTIANKIGKASIIRGGKEIPAKRGMKIYATDVLKTQARTAVKLQFVDGGTIMAFQGTKMSIDEYQVKGKGNNSSLKSKFKIATGKIRFFVKPRQDKSKVKATFRTANAVMGIRGTSGYIDVSKRGKTQLIVLTGKVAVANVKTPGTSILVSKNKMTDIVGTRKPTPARSAPANLVQNLEKQNQSAGGNSSEGGAENSGDSQPAEEKKEEKSEQKEESNESSDGEQKKEDDNSGQSSEGESQQDEGGGDSGSSEGESGEKNSGDASSDDSSNQEASGGESSQGEDSQQDSAQSNEDSSNGGSAEQSGEGNNSASGDSGDSNNQAPGDSQEAPASADGGSSDSSAPSSAAEPQPAAAPEEPAPAPQKVEKKVIFSPDGSSSVHVEDQSIQDLGKNIPATDVGGASQNVAPAASEAPPPVAPAAIAQPSIVSEQTELVKQQIEKIQEVNNEIIEEVQEVQQTERIIEEAIKKKKVKIRVKLPTSP